MPVPVEEFRVEWDRLDRLDEFLERRLADTDKDTAPGVPFDGGWIGFIAYETGAAWEGAEPREAPGVPAALFYRHEKVIAIGPDERGPAFSAASPPAPLRIAERGGQPSGGEVGRGEARLAVCVDDSLAGDRYGTAHEAIREGISLGDYYQVNLTRRFRTQLNGPVDAGELYRVIAGDPPPGYSAFIRGPGFDLLSASPELFLRADFFSREVEMRPIKGTAPRHHDAALDRAEAEKLLASPKDRAENVMIVDLCRNDLGRVCEPGSIAVPHLCRLASHRVHHLESVIRGRLSSKAAPKDVIHAAFPPGSVTGTPKRAAVAAVRSLEPVARGIYTGAVGYFDRRGRLAFNVAIRTALVRGAEVEYHAGGGITWGSNVVSEDRESKLKAREFFEMISADRGE